MENSDYPADEEEKADDKKNAIQFNQKSTEKTVTQDADFVYAGEPFEDYDEPDEDYDDDLK